MNAEIHRAGDGQLLVRFPDGQSLVGHPMTLGLVLRDAFLRYEQRYPDLAHAPIPSDISKPCAACGRHFAPNGRQIYCTDANCRRRRSREYQRDWHAKRHPAA
jgi:hypothetical protein